MSSSKKKTTGKQSTASRREALRAQQEAAAKQKRTRRVMALIAAVLALAVIAVVGVVVWQDQKKKREIARNEAQVQITPPNAVDTTGILVNPEAKDAKYTLSVYVDYQCSACASVEKDYGPVWKKLADEGFVKLQINTKTFLQPKYGDYSEPLAIGAACADTVGKYWDFHSNVFPFQGQSIPLYSDRDVEKTIPDRAGIIGKDYDRWKTCFDNKQTAKFVREVQNNAERARITATPSITINGKNPQVDANTESGKTDWWRTLDPDVEQWKAAIEKHAA